MRGAAAKPDIAANILSNDFTFPKSPRGESPAVGRLFPSRRPPNPANFLDSPARFATPFDAGS